MRQFLIFLVLFMAAPTLALAEVELKGSPEQLAHYLSSMPKEVVLTGEAKLEILADSGIVTVGIKTEHQRLQQALQDNQTRRNEIVAQLVQFGLAQERIRGTKFSSTPEYGFFGEKPKNYVVENMLKITVESENELQEVARIVDSHRDVFYQGLELKEQEKDAIKKKLLDLALANANVRKKTYEAELGVALIPIGFEEYIAVTPQPARPRQLQKNKMLYEVSSSAGSGSYSEALSFGEHTYQGSVNVRYRVSPKKTP